MKIIGLTGGIASGKSTVAKFLQQKNIPLVYADLVAHEIIALGTPAHREIVEVFGSHILCEDGTINRQELGKIVFSDRGKLQILNEITHSRVAARAALLFDLFRQQNYPLTIYEVPLLFENKLQDQFDAIILVSIPLELQLKRLQSRESLSKEDALARIKSQMPLEKKEVLADYVIENTGSLDDLRVLTDNILKKLLPIEGKK